MKYKPKLVLWPKPEPPFPRPNLEHIRSTSECPECKAWALELYKVSGLTYFECSQCNHTIGKP
jgi:hypothetical protein